MDTGLAATIVTVFGGGLVAAFLKVLDRRRRPAEQAAADVVERVAAGRTATFGPEALVAMAQMLTTQNTRIDQLERHGGAYLARIAVVEHLAIWADGPVPRTIPAWVDDPRLQHE